MHSTDSLWGCDGEEEDTVSPLNNDADCPQPPETWLMLEFCDRGSLLVSVCMLKLATPSLRKVLVISQSVYSFVHIHSRLSGLYPLDNDRMREFCGRGSLLVSVHAEAYHFLST